MNKLEQDYLDVLVEQQNLGKPAGIASICSAHPLVLDEAVRHAKLHGYKVLIEATCNQVNQEGGYTGMTPLDFKIQIQQIAEKYSLTPEELILGGDHLGPNPWKHLASEVAMAKSEEMVRAYVEAGFTKIHLDASMRLADDEPGALPTKLIAERTAQLAAVAEESAGILNSNIRYVIGTEVPVPGGESAGAHGIHVTKVNDLNQTLEETKSAFLALGLKSAWDRVRAVVAQPGVEFSDSEIFRYRASESIHLKKFLEQSSTLVLEAHSTDYQTVESLRALVADRFAILKVGPGLTFAYREGVFALSFIEDALELSDSSQIRSAIENAMLEDPNHWKAFYSEDSSKSKYSRKYSRSDRSRYYWPNPIVQLAIDKLISNLDKNEIPEELLSQFLPIQYAQVIAGKLENKPINLLRDKIREVLDDYLLATNTK